MLEEILKYLGIDPATTKDIEGFRKEFGGKYYNKKSFEDQKSNEFRELFPTMIGKFAGKNTTKLQSFLKSKGVELKDDEIKDKDFEEILELGLTKFHSKYDGDITKLKEDGTKNTDDKVKELTEQLAKIKIKNEDLDTMLKTTKSTFEEKEKGFDSEKKSWKLNSKKGDLFKAINFSDEVKKDPLKQKGFMSLIEESLAFDFDDKDEFVAHDKKSGKLIPNPAKNGTFFSPEEAINDLGSKSNVIAKNPHGSGGPADNSKFKASGSPASGNFGNQNSGSIFEGPQQGARPRRTSAAIKEE